jgi:guanyl-specific ribonuclease Sa
VNERRARSGIRAGLAALLSTLLAAFLLVGCAAGTGAEGTGAGGSGSATGVLDPAGSSSGSDRSADGGASCPAPSPTAPGAAESRLPIRSLCALPAEAAPVWRTIAGGGRPAYPKDGTTFGNFERRLPSRGRDYYREYTVPTPGSRDRGARRLISGNGHELYYTGDHYASFVVVDPTAGGPGS